MSAPTTMTEMTLGERRERLIEERRAEQSRLDAASADSVDNPERAADAANAEQRLRALGKAIAAIDAQVAAEADAQAQRERQAAYDAEIQSLVDLSRSAAEMFGTLLVLRDDLAKHLDETVRTMATLRQGLRATQRQFLDAADRIAPGFEIREGRSLKDRVPPHALRALTDAIRARGGTFDGLVVNWQPPNLGSLNSVVAQVSGAGLSHPEARSLPITSTMSMVVDSLVDVAMGDLAATAPGIEGPLVAGAVL